MNAPARYKILETLGHGAMGVVYRAHQSGLAREVALKCIRSEEPPSAAFLERFRREALALAKVSHPNLVKIYDVGNDDAKPYIAMELIPGRSLEALLREKPVEVRRRATDLFRDILDAVVTLHDAGLAHRDLKPANIMITPDWRPVVMDLGLVKDFQGDGTAITRTGTLIGTPAYLAPEVIGGSVASLAADVWALGCLYFAMNAGMAPFRGATLPELYQAITTDPLPDLEVSCADLPEARRGLLAQMLERRPERRPRSARRVLELLRGAVGTSRPVRRVSSSQLVKPPRPHGLAPALAVLAMAVVLAGLWMRRQPVDVTPVRPTPQVPASAPAGAESVEDVRARAKLIAGLGGRDVQPMAPVIREMMDTALASVPAPGQARRAHDPSVAGTLDAATRAQVLAKQRRIAERWLTSAHGLDLRSLCEAVPRWLADPALPADVRYQIYRAISSISNLDAATEASVGGPLIDSDALVSGYVKIQRGGPPPPPGYRPLPALAQPGIVELQRTSFLVFFAMIPTEAGLFPESWWDSAQAVMQVLEVPGSRQSGLPWYDLGRLPASVAPAKVREVTVRVADMDPTYRLWIRFGKHRTVCLRNTRRFKQRGASGTELPAKAVLEGKAVTLSATLPEGFLAADDRQIALGCDSVPMGDAYNLRYFWLVDLIVDARPAP